MPGKSSRILALLALISGCGGVPLTAPDGAVLQITASPLSIPIVDGVSNITVIASKASDDGGGPVADGTQIFFTTPIGVIEERVETRSGIARATLRSDGRSGEASIVATAGAGASVTLNPPVVIGVSDATRIVLLAIPPIARAPDFTSDIVATVLDERGNPIRDVPLVFSTTAGRLASSGSVIRTDASGRATDRLALGNERLARVTAQTGSVVSETLTVIREDAGGIIITDVTPSSGNPGQTLEVEISGRGFEDDATVSFGGGGVRGTVLSITSTSIRVEVDIDDTATPGPRNVTVSNPGPPVTSDTLRGGFTVGSGGPTVTGIDPDVGDTGDRIEAEIEGTNFQTGAQVTIGDIPRINVSNVRETSITVSFDIPEDATPGARDVTVTNRDGRSGTLPDGFTVELPAPDVREIDPEFGPPGGTLTVTITGSNFAPGVTADFGDDITVDVIDESVSVEGDTFQVTLTISPSAEQNVPRDVTVTVGSKTGTLEGAFTVRF